jgi:hypothetical protein
MPLAVHPASRGVFTLCGAYDDIQGTRHTVVRRETGNA